MVKYFLFVWGVTAQFSVAAQVPNRATTIRFDFVQPLTDTIDLYINVNTITREGRRIRLPLRNGKAETTIPSVYAHVFASVGSLRMAGVVSPGNDYMISADTLLADEHYGSAMPPSFKVSTALYRFSDDLMKNRSKNLKALIADAKLRKDPYGYMYRYFDTTKVNLLHLLDQVAPKLDTTTVKILRADIEARFLGYIYNIPGNLTGQPPAELMNQKDLPPSATKSIASRLVFDDRFAQSDAYAEAVYTILYKEYAARQFNNDNHRLIEKYDFVDSVLKGMELRLPVTALFLENDLSQLNQGEDIAIINNRSFKGAEKSLYATYIAKRIGNLFTTGMPAPDFTLENTKGKLVSKKDFAGKVVLMDFWFRECIPCKVLHDKLEPVRAQFAGDTSVVFLTISIDDRASWLKTLQERKMNGYAVYTQGKREAHPVISAYKVAGYPTICLLDGKGRIAMATPSHIPEELMAQIKKAKE